MLCNFWHKACFGGMQVQVHYLCLNVGSALELHCIFEYCNKSTWQCLKSKAWGRHDLSHWNKWAADGRWGWSLFRKQYQTETIFSKYWNNSCAACRYTSQAYYNAHKLCKGFQKSNVCHSTKTVLIPFDVCLSSK